MKKFYYKNIRIILISKISQIIQGFLLNESCTSKRLSKVNLYERWFEQKYPHVN